VFRAEYSKSALKALREMPRNIAEIIRAKIVTLLADPYGSHNNAMRLQGRTGYRLRVGDWRVLYELDDKQKVLLVLDIKPRGGAYQ
jgi:mRNA interferase RelE/StbE